MPSPISCGRHSLRPCPVDGPSSRLCSSSACSTSRRAIRARLVIAGDQARPSPGGCSSVIRGESRPRSAVFLVQFGTWGLAYPGTGDLGTSIFTSLPVTGRVDRASGSSRQLSLMVIYASAHYFRSPCRSAWWAAWKAGDLDRPRHHDLRGVSASRCRSSSSAMCSRTCFALQFEWFARAGLHAAVPKGSGPWLQNLILPSIALGCVYIALIAPPSPAPPCLRCCSRIISAPRARQGVGGQRGILFVHALKKRGRFPIVTVIGIGNCVADRRRGW